MTKPGPSPTASVQVIQALVARELVEGFGISERHAAELLGVVPSSVSQYLSGKRLGPTLSDYLGNEDARQIARRTADELVAGTAGSRAILEAAIQLSERFRQGSPTPRAGGKLTLRPELQRKVPGWLRNRIAGEQSAVSECMRLAQRSRDELTRALFRQIASDSLRHAEIVASLAAYLDRGVSSSSPTGITRADVEQLIQREHEAEATSEIDLGPELGGVMRILWDSMESDEKKHEHLLQQLLDADLVDHRVPRKPSRRSN
ncbi:MAG: hypothetical protein ACRECT_03240 [Thermoplasmata archaeon]